MSSSFRLVTVCAAFAFAGVGCDQHDCASYAIVIQGATISTVELSGPACAGDVATCYATSNGECVAFGVSAHAAGNCHIEIDVAGRAPITRDVAITSDDRGEACSGYDAVAASDENIDVDALLDAGTD